MIFLIKEIYVKWMGKQIIELRMVSNDEIITGEITGKKHIHLEFYKYESIIN